MRFIKTTLKQRHAKQIKFHIVQDASYILSLYI